MLKWSLCNIFFFLNGFAPISFCTSKTLCPFPSPPWLITFLLLIKINRGRVRHTVIQGYTLLSIWLPLPLTFHLLSRCSFVFLQVKLPQVSTYNSFFKVIIVSVVSIVHQNLYLSTCSKYTTKLLFRELSAENYFLRWLGSNVVLWHAEGFLVNLSRVVETRAMIWRSYVPKKGSNQDIQVFLKTKRRVMNISCPCLDHCWRKFLNLKYCS